MWNHCAIGNAKLSSLPVNDVHTNFAWALRLFNIDLARSTVSDSNVSRARAMYFDAKREIDDLISKGWTNPKVLQEWELLRDSAAPQVFHQPPEDGIMRMYERDRLAEGVAGFAAAYLHNPTGEIRHVMIIASRDRLDAVREWPRYYTEHLKAATVLREDLFMRKYMQAPGQRFCWGLGFSYDAADGLKASSAANIKLSERHEPVPRQLTERQYDKFVAMMGDILSR